jgi:Flp pilus assembly protein TadB
MLSYGLKLGLAAAGILIAGIIVILIFDAIWFRVGMGAAIAILAGILIFFAWRSDRKAREAREGLEQI